MAKKNPSEVTRVRRAVGKSILHVAEEISNRFDKYKKERKDRFYVGIIAVMGTVYPLDKLYYLNEALMRLECGGVAQLDDETKRLVLELECGNSSCKYAKLLDNPKD